MSDAKALGMTQRPVPSVQEILNSDTRPVPAALRENRADFLGDEDLDRERYFSPDFYRLENDRMWSRTWQMACRVEQIPEVGDHVVYEVADKSLIVMRSAPDKIKAFFNVCLHRGRILRETGGHVANLRCKFHGFTWQLDGTLSAIPAQWDFPHVDQARFCLPEAKVGVWGGFVFINMDPDAMPLEQYLGEVPAHFKAWDFEHRFIAGHVGKVIDANWKVALEAFLETWHVLATHPQVLPFVGDANSQYDVSTDRPHTSRLIIPMAVASPFVAESTSEQEILDGMRMQLGGSTELKLPPGKTARQYSAELMRARMSRMTNGRDFSAASDSEMLDAIVYFIFPNFIMWGGYSNLLYRFRPWSNNPEQSMMEMILFPPTPKDAPTPPPASMNLLGLDKTFADAVELGDLGAFFNQDLGNMAWVQKGMRAARKPGLTLARYQEIQIRHFHRTLDMYVYGENGRAH